MARVRRDVWECDAPGCPVTVPVSEDAPRGFSGKVSGEGGTYPPNVPFFACSSAHVLEAILHVMRVAHERAWS